MKAKKLTLARIATHDFNRALRVWKAHQKAPEILAKLTGEQANALARALRSMAAAVVGTLWLAASKPDLSLKVYLIDITIHTAYVNFFVAALLFGALTNLINYFMLTGFARIATIKLLKFDSAWALAAFHGDGNVWSLPLVQQFRFLESNSRHRGLGLLMMALANLPFIMVLTVAYWTVMVIGLQVLRQDGFWSTPGCFTVAGWLMMLYPIALAIVLRIPFKFTKNTTFIRWNFLYAMYKRSGSSPPRVGDWLAESKAGS